MCEPNKGKSPHSKGQKTRSLEEAEEDTNLFTTQCTVEGDVGQTLPGRRWQRLILGRRSPARKSEKLVVRLSRYGSQDLRLVVVGDSQRILNRFLAGRLLDVPIWAAIHLTLARSNKPFQRASPDGTSVL